MVAASYDGRSAAIVEWGALKKSRPKKYVPMYLSVKTQANLRSVRHICAPKGRIFSGGCGRKKGIRKMPTAR